MIPFSTPTFNNYINIITLLSLSMPLYHIYLLIFCILLSQPSSTNIEFTNNKPKNKKSMSIMVNGQSCVPPGFRFHPTEEELLNYYLRKKLASEKIDLDVIRDVDLNKLEPWDILEKCRIGSTPQNDWYFFSHKDKKYPTGTRTNRATAAGFWKATGRDKVIYAGSKRIGMRKTLVFYKGRAPHGHKSDWIMHEYRLDEHSDHCSSISNALCSIGDASAQEDGWVVCRVFKKKNLLHKAVDSPNNCSSLSTGDAKSQLLISSSGGGDGALEQILQYMGRSCKQETEAVTNNSISTSNNYNSYQTRSHLRPMETLSGTSFTKLLPLESPTSLPPLVDDFPTAAADYFSQSGYQPEGIHVVVSSNLRAYQPEPDWAALDRLVASHLNGQSEASKQLACLQDDEEFDFSGSREYHSNVGCSSGGDGDGDLWSLASSASDVHVSRVSHESM